MAIVKCGRGHTYDNSVYMVCPTCSGGNNVRNFNNYSDIPTSALDPISKTAPAGGNFGGADPIGATQPVGGFGGNSSSDIGPTIGFKPVNEKASDDIGRTEIPDILHGKGNSNGGLLPVVGWLVCIDGAGTGKDYRLMPKINTVGRGANHDVNIEDDVQISSHVQAKIAYDPMHNNFTLVSGEGAGTLNYLNGNAVYTYASLEAYDVVKMGNTKLMFVPFCSDRFQWSKVDSTQDQDHVMS